MERKMQPKKPSIKRVIGILAVIFVTLLSGCAHLNVNNLNRSAGTARWKFKLGNRGSSSPAIGPDGTIYVESNGWNNYLYALNPDGTSKWKFKLGNRGSSSPAIGPDGTIYYGDIERGPYDYLYALNPDGTLKWKFEIEGYISLSSLAIGPEGTIYMGSSLSCFSGGGYLHALNPDGTLKWKFETGGHGAPRSFSAIGSDGTIYYGGLNVSYLYALNPDGTLKWKFETGGSRISPPAIGPDGTIYMGSSSLSLVPTFVPGAVSVMTYRYGYLHALNPDGTLKWNIKIGGPIRSSPAIGADGTIYVGAGNVVGGLVGSLLECGYLHALNPDGTLKWKFETLGSVDLSPAIGADGTIYVEDDFRLYALNPDGTSKWKFKLGNRGSSSPAIGPDGTIYVGTNGFWSGCLYAINSDSHGLANSSWPMLFHDLRHTGNVRNYTGSGVHTN
jgi:outer membrane protein assembly factor BamB